MRKSNWPFITWPKLQSRQRVGYLIVGIQISYQRAGVGHSNHDQNVPGGHRYWKSIHTSLYLKEITLFSRNYTYFFTYTYFLRVALFAKWIILPTGETFSKWWMAEVLDHTEDVGRCFGKRWVYKVHDFDIWDQVCILRPLFWLGLAPYPCFSCFLVVSLLLVFLCVPSLFPCVCVQSGCGNLLLLLHIHLHSWLSSTNEWAAVCLPGSASVSTRPFCFICFSV